MRGVCGWTHCQTCNQQFTGPTRTGLAKVWWSRVYASAEQVGECRPEKHVERYHAAEHIASDFGCPAEWAGAQSAMQERRVTYTLLWGDDAPVTLNCLRDLWRMYHRQNKYAKADRPAEQVIREMLRAHRQVLGDEHPNTRDIARDLAQSLAKQGKYAEAEAIIREVLRVAKQVLDEEHPYTLMMSDALEICFRPKTSTRRRSGSTGGWIRYAVLRGGGYSDPGSIPRRCELPLRCEMPRRSGSSGSCKMRRVCRYMLRSRCSRPPAPWLLNKLNASDAMMPLRAAPPVLCC
jgi:hypothetical protein